MRGGAQRGAARAPAAAQMTDLTDFHATTTGGTASGVFPKET